MLHELAHMWFGDLVTMQWWDDLWLNESFAEWASTLCQAEATEWSGAWTTFQSHEKTWAYQQDQLPSTHPVYADIRDLDDVLVNFDGITYAKGGSILKQLVAYVGREPSMRALQSYFRKHAWGNTRFADLLAELEEASGRDLGPWSDAWLKTAGVNTLEVEVSTDAAGVITEAAVLQTAAEAYPTLRPHRIAIGRYDLVDGALVRVGRHELDIDGARTPLPELVGLPQPDLLLPNDDDLSYAKLRFDERSYATALAHTAAFAESLPGPSSSPRCGRWSARVRCRRATSSTCCSSHSRSRPTRSSCARSCRRRSRSRPSCSRRPSLFCAPEHRGGPAPGGRRTAGRGRGGRRRQRPAVPARRRLRPGGPGDSDIARLRGAFDGTRPYPGLEIDQDLRWALLAALAPWARPRGRDRGRAAPRRHERRSRAGVPRAGRAADAAAKAEAWRLAVEEDGQPNAVIEALASGWNRAVDQSLLQDYVPRYFDMLLPVWNSRSAAIRERIIGKEYPLAFYPFGLASPALAATTEAWLDANPDAPQALRRLIAEKLDATRTAVLAQQCDAKRA